MTSAPAVAVEALTHRAFAGPGRERVVLDRVTFALAAGETLALLGQVGSCRARLLRLIAGQETPDGGRILMGGQDVTRWPPARRPVGFVFHQDPLFGHATVFDALAAALPEGTGPDGVPTKVQTLLDQVGLGQDGSWSPVTLTPLKRQRLALARALARDPRVMLVAEAFAAGPGPRRFLAELHRALGIATIFAARDAAEALAVADRIAVLHEGRVVQLATPAELLRAPASEAVATLLGRTGAGFQGLELRPGVPTVVPPGGLELTEAWRGTPARVVRSTRRGARLVIELELLSDGSHLTTELPGLGPASLLPPGSLIGVRLRRTDGAMGSA